MSIPFQLSIESTENNTRDIPEGHLALLDKREEPLKAGEAALLELDDFIAEMKRRMP